MRTPYRLRPLRLFLTPCTREALRRSADPGSRWSCSAGRSPSGSTPNGTRTPRSRRPSSTCWACHRWASLVSMTRRRWVTSCKTLLHVPRRPFQDRTSRNLSRPVRDRSRCRRDRGRVRSINRCRAWSPGTGRASLPRRTESYIRRLLDHQNTREPTRGHLKAEQQAYVSEPRDGRQRQSTAES